MARLGITMLRHGVTIFAERLGVAVGLHFNSGAARVTSLGELTASMAHEVNQPLTAVIMQKAHATSLAAPVRVIEKPCMCNPR